MVINLFLIIPVVLYCLSGLADAFMDTLAQHFSTSIFSAKNPQFWNPSVSWLNKYNNNTEADGHKTFNVFGLTFNTLDVFSDAWHIGKLFREGANILAIVACGYIGLQHGYLFLGGYFLVLSILRNEIFNLGYNHLFVK